MAKQKKLKFDLMEILNQKSKDEKLKMEGAIIAFRLDNGQTGTWTICEDLGIRLRLIQECKIQERIMEKQVEEMAQTTMSFTPKLKEENKEKSYLG